jgi:glutaredoxin 3
MAKVVVYTMHSCPYCVRAKALLKERGIPFEERLLEYEDDAAWAELETRTGMKTMPQILHGDQLIGGYSELSTLDRETKLQGLRESG